MNSLELYIMKNLLLLLCAFCMSFSLYAQSDIAGTVVDTTGNSLPGANAILLRSSDSLLTSFGTTDGKGNFLMKDVPIGEYILRVSFLGFERPEQNVTVTKDDQYLGLGDLKMYPAGFLLNGVEVTADRIPIRMKGDTMMYDADAFAVGDNAAVEDLLRRMPGMSIDANGAITWRGQAVQQILINGKPFFSGNTSLITQNLDAKAIKSVEVFDKKSNKEELTGTDDGEDNTTVNLEMKEEFKAKIFGELYGGYGTMDSYEAGGNIFRISEASQLGALGTINNVNKVGFSGDELSNYNQSIGRGAWFSRGGSDGSLPVYGNGQTPGQNRSIAAGLNYGTTIGEGQLQLGYTLFDKELSQAQKILEAFNTGDRERTTETEQSDASGSYSHGISLNYEADIDTISRLDIIGAAYLTGNDATGNAGIAVRDQANGNQDYTVNEKSTSERPGGDLSINYGRRLGKPGRFIEFEVNGEYGESRNDLSVLTEGLNEELTISGALINGLQTQNRITKDLRYGGSIDYEEPLSEKWLLEADANYIVDESKGDYDFQLREERVDNLLTRNWNQLRVGTELERRFGRRNSFSFGARYYNSELRLEGDEMRSNRYNHILPFMRMRIRGKKGFYGLRFSASPNAPGISQLQTIAQPGNSGRVSVGNPDLTPSVNYRGSGFMWFNDQFRAISANANLSIRYSDNAFGNELTFTQGQQIYRPVNVSHSWNTNLYLGTTIGVNAINGEVRLSAQGGMSTGQGFVNGISRINTATNASAGLNLTTEFNEKSFLTAGYTYGLNRNAFDDDESETIKTVTHDLLGQFELELSPKWRFESRFLYRIFEAAAFANAANIPDLGMSLEIRPFKKAPHFFRFSVFDMFNQNTVINRQAQAFVTRETTSDALGRYFLGTFHYKIN